jgi:8-oxo-dGTP pyrophosphatase MutT (NUDIX family)
MEQKYLCNNCGNYGHLFYNCKKPITSLGIICIRAIDKADKCDTPDKYDKYEYLLVQRKDSLGYVDFLRGKYNEHNDYQITNIILEMTDEEINNITTNRYRDMWDKLWNKVNEKYEQKNEDKYNYIKEHKSYLLKHNGWKEPEWGFPKGRRNFKEKDLECALREFEEETGYNKNHLKIIKNLNPFDEIFTGSNFKSYKHKYFLAKIDYEDSLNETNYQKSEIGNMGWFTYEDAIQKIRPYNIEKIELLSSLHQLLETNQLF